MGRIIGNVRKKVRESFCGDFVELLWTVISSGKKELYRIIGKDG